MPFGRGFFLALAKSSYLNNHVTKWGFVRRATKKFMPGEAPEDALVACAALAASGRGTIFTKLGEAITNKAEATAVRDHYMWLYDEIKRRGLPGVVSVKPTQLGLDIDEALCEAYTMELAAKAESCGSFLWIDMEDSNYVDRTLALYRKVKTKHAATGLAMQAYLFRTPKDVADLMPVKPVIRLVKGAYAEPPHVAFPRKADTDRAYYEIADHMLQAAKAGNCLPIFGTHDVALVGRIVARAKELGVAPGKYEVHMLYGIKDAEQQRLRRDGQVVKTLVSYGAAWFKWYMRRLAERPANVGFVIRSMIG
ncbi:MAG TPA: proline dehydrogenase family protein [Gemmatimonadaceae bacterium]|nr:proline dehydrogenase family protein [Gemmatimonadaceae bacterium]